MRKKEWRSRGWVSSIHMFVLNVAPGTTAKRLHTTAQGCRVAATLGSPIEQDRRNPNGVAKVRNIALTQRSRGAATLGCVVQPLRGCGALVLVLAIRPWLWGRRRRGGPAARPATRPRRHGQPPPARWRRGPAGCETP